MSRRRPAPQSPPRPLRVYLPYLIVARLVLSTAHRFAYPFLPAISRGLGVSLESGGLLMSARAFAGLATPLLVATVGRGERRRRTLAAGFALFALGAGVTAASGVYAGAFTGFVLFGLAKPLVDISGQAYIADRVPYRRRGRHIALFESTWSLALLVGAPAAGWLIARWGWRAPFWAVAALALVALGTLFWAVDPDAPRRTGGSAPRLRLHRSTALILGALFALMFAAEVSILVFGAWLEDGFNLSLVALGGAATALGLAELAAEGTSFALTDRLAFSFPSLIKSIGRCEDWRIMHEWRPDGQWSGAGRGHKMLFSRARTRPMTDLSIARQLAPYKPKHKVRFVTAASLFDGHDASINIMRRILQATGAEVIHLGHNRSVQEIVNAALQEDVQGICITSYQGGHVEFFRYMIDLLKANGGSEIKVFGGGGGVIVPAEIRELHEYGVTRIYAPEDGVLMGLQGMINEVVQQSDFDLAAAGVPGAEQVLAGLKAGDKRLLARAITLLENGAAPALKEPVLKAAAELDVPVLGITGTGGAGKSSLTDELLLRFVRQFPDRNIAVVAMDPTRRRSGGADRATGHRRWRGIGALPGLRRPGRHRPAVPRAGVIAAVGRGHWPEADSASTRFFGSLPSHSLNFSRCSFKQPESPALRCRL